MKTAWTLAMLSALFALLESPVAAQGALDTAAAGAAAGNLDSVGGAVHTTSAAAIRGPGEAMATGAARTDAKASAAASEAGGAKAGGGAAAGTAAAPAGEGRKGLILYDQLGGAAGRGRSFSEELVGSGGGSGDPVPETYIVAKGDTLWSICARFFGDPYYWPKLWSFNEMITNPHWIYPGDLLSMYAPGQAPKAAAVEEEEPQDPEKPQVRRTIKRGGPQAPKGLQLTQNGFVEPGELDVSGRVAGSKEEKLMLATGDEVYVETSRKQPFKVGQSYTIYRVLRPVKRPSGRHEVLGNIVEIVGQVYVQQITSAGVARAVIRGAVGPVERGFRVGPLRRTFKQVDPKNNRANLEGVVIAALQPTSLLGVEQLIFFDMGRSTGLETGNRLFVVRRGDGVLKLLSTEPVDDRRYPREVVAEIIVVDVRDRTSAGLILRETKDIRIGDRVEARKGY